MGDDIIYRLYESGDEEGIVELLLTSFEYLRNAASPLAYYRWKYLECPMPPIIVVAQSGEKIVGVNHFHCSRMKIGETMRDTCYGTDVATHPDYRGRGIYNRINVIAVEEQRRKGIKIGFSFTSNKTISNRGQRKGRLQFPHKFIEMARINNIDKYLGTRKSTRIRIGYKVVLALNMISTLSRKKLEASSLILETSKFEQSTQDFLTKAQEGYTLFPEINIEYLTWRYLNPHAGEIQVKAAVHNGEVLGYIATELWKISGVNQGCVSELIALPGRLDVAEALLRDACSHYDNLGVNAIFYRVFDGHPYRAIAGKCGFIDTSMIQKFYFEWQYKDAKEEFETLRAASPEKLHLPHGRYF